MIFWKVLSIETSGKQVTIETSATENFTIEKIDVTSLNFAGLEQTVKILSEPHSNSNSTERMIIIIRNKSNFIEKLKENCS